MNQNNVNINESNNKIKISNLPLEKEERRREVGKEMGRAVATGIEHATL